MDCLDLLTADHNRVRGLFKRFKDAESSDDMATMTLVTTKIVEELLIHMAIEEEIFYPAIKPESDQVKDTVLEGVEEHHVAKDLVVDLAETDPTAEEWPAKVKVLIEAVEHHADEEESEMFTEVRKELSEDERVQLGERLAARKVELGAPPLEEALDLTMEELKSKAKEQEIPGRSKMKKEELAATVDPRA
jgi:hemerythrin-like domain-containing protein